MFDISQDVFSEDGDYDGGRVEDYINGVMQEFAKSPEASTIRALRPRR
jgi:hypothetical protein